MGKIGRISLTVVAGLACCFSLLIGVEAVKHAIAVAKQPKTPVEAVHRPFDSNSADRFEADNALIFSQAPELAPSGRAGIRFAFEGMIPVTDVGAIWAGAGDADGQCLSGRIDDNGKIVNGRMQEHLVVRQAALPAQDYRQAMRRLDRMLGRSYRDRNGVDGQTVLFERYEGSSVVSGWGSTSGSAFYAPAQELLQKLVDKHCGARAPVIVDRVFERKWSPATQKDNDEFIQRYLEEHPEMKP